MMLCRSGCLGGILVVNDQLATARCQPWACPRYPLEPFETRLNLGSFPSGHAESFRNPPENPPGFVRHYRGSRQWWLPLISGPPWQPVTAGRPTQVYSSFPGDVAVGLLACWQRSISAN